MKSIGVCALLVIPFLALVGGCKKPPPPVALRPTVEPVVWGPVTDGVQARIELSAAVAGRGEPVSATVVLKNVSEGDLVLFPNGIRLAVRNAEAVFTPKRGFDDPFWGGAQLVPAGRELRVFLPNLTDYAGRWELGAGPNYLAADYTVRQEDMPDGRVALPAGKRWLGSTYTNTTSIDRLGVPAR